MRPSITSVEFLRSKTGTQFARALVEDIVALPQPPDPSGRAADPETEFEELVNDFAALVQQYKPADDFREHLRTVYRDRFIDMCPPEGEARTAYYYAIFKIVPFLALLAGNVWKLDTGQYEGYPKPRPDRKLSLYHLQWAREAFGWWRANVERLPYYLELGRPCKTSPALDAMAEALGDVIGQLPKRGKVEVDNGCPIC